MLLGGYKKKKKILDLAKQYALRPDLDWTVYYKNMGELLRK
jgi:hypothetical protein